MARKSILATLVGVTAIGAPVAMADMGGQPHDGSNGQGRPAATQQQTAATAPHGKALAKGHAKTHANTQAKAVGHAKTHPSGRALAKGHAKTQTHGNSATPNVTPPGPPASNTHAKAGKTTFCHATGSATNPYVTITTSNNALPAHRRHQDGRDIIPAPAGGCPQGSTEQNRPAGQEQGKTTICHATGSATNPFVIITISNSALPAHSAHQDGRDIIPAPSNGVCAAENSNGEQPGGQPLTPGTTGSSVTPTMAPGVTPTAGAPAVAGATTTGTSPNRVKVLGATTSGRAPAASTSPAATGTRAASSSGLPFTGTDALIVAILGLAALLIGVTMRRAAALRSGRS